MAEPYYRMSSQQVLDKLDTSTDGLTSEQARVRLESHGPNKLAEGKKKSVFVVFLEQFKDLLVAILIIAAGISMLMGDAESTLVIIAVLILNAVLGTVQYMKAEKSLDALKNMSAPVAKVLRDGAREEIAGPDVVPGDLVFLEAGDMVVADGRLVECYSLKVNESSLTGESEAVEKDTEALSGDSVALGDQKNMAFSGSLVTYGRGLMVVTGTGMQTEIGHIAHLMNQTQQRKTPLQQNLDDFSKKLAAAVLAVCVLVFALSVFRSHMPVMDSLLFAVALAVAAIPEALSSIVTIVLAMGTQKMAKENAIIKDLKAVESLGSVRVICSDKTGTLTQNKMTVVKAWFDGKEVEAADASTSDPVAARLIRVGLLASDATTDEETGAAVGDPTEIALVDWGDAHGMREEDARAAYERLGELAFDSDRKLMSTVHEVDGSLLMLTKGAPDVLLARCVRMMTADGDVELTDEMRKRIARANDDFSRQGLRVLAFANRTVDSADVTFDDERDFTFVGLTAMVDPPRMESAQAVADAKRGGIRTVMITGDHKVTAAAIGRSVGIFEDGDIALEGTELDAMTDEQLDEILPKVSVYARVSPEHKIRIVSAWQRRGCIVSMTGDGVNDAPALKRADVGVAMGITGTEVSKDAASMVLADDNFATIVKAVVNGRSIYANIKSSIHFLLSGNMAGIMAVLFASLMALPVPFASVHLLFINLLTDSLPAIALGLEPARKGLLDQKPRDPKASILDAPLARKVVWHGALIATASMTAFFIGLNAGGAALASTMAFATLALARLFHGFNCRGGESIFKLGLFTNKWVPLAWLGGFVLLALVLFVPFLQSAFSVAPLTAVQFAQIVGLAFAPTAIVQIGRLIKMAFDK